MESQISIHILYEISRKLSELILVPLDGNIFLLYYFINLLPEDSYVSKQTFQQFPHLSHPLEFNILKAVQLIPTFNLWREEIVPGSREVLNSNWFWQENLYHCAIAFSTGLLYQDDLQLLQQHFKCSVLLVSNLCLVKFPQIGFASWGNTTYSHLFSRLLRRKTLSPCLHEPL